MENVINMQFGKMSARLLKTDNVFGMCADNIALAYSPQTKLAFARNVMIGQQQERDDLTLVFLAPLIDVFDALYRDILFPFPKDGSILLAQQERNRGHKHLLKMLHFPMYSDESKGHEAMSLLNGGTADIRVIAIHRYADEIKNVKLGDGIQTPTVYPDHLQTNHILPAMIENLNNFTERNGGASCYNVRMEGDKCAGLGFWAIVPFANNRVILVEINADPDEI